MYLKQQDALREFLKEIDPANKVAVTLNLKQRDGHTRLDKIEAVKNFRHFMNRINKKAYGNMFTRYGKRLEVIPILERSFSGRLHYHAVLENPFPDIPTCHAKIQECWFKTRWGYGQQDVQSIYSDGWIDYITKANATDVWDVENTYRVC